MQLWQDGLVAALAAIGVASIMWAVVRTVLFAAPPRKYSAVALISAKGDGTELEEQVRTLIRLRQEQGVFGAILVVDCGLNEEGKKVVKCLERQDRWVSFCQKENLSEYLSAAGFQIFKT